LFLFTNFNTSKPLKSGKFISNKTIEYLLKLIFETASVTVFTISTLKSYSCKKIAD